MANFVINFAPVGGDNNSSYNDASQPSYLTLFPQVSIAVSGTNHNNANTNPVTIVLNISNPESTMSVGFFDSNAAPAQAAAQAANVTVSFDATSGNITLAYTGGGNGPSPATWNSILKGLEYQNTAVEDGVTHNVTLVSATPAVAGGYQNVSAADADTITAVCFYPGTAVRTPGGEAAVETLQRGDLVMTADGAVAPVRWIGRQTVSTVFADKRRVLPVRIKANALADNTPSRDLLVSPDHALLVEGVLVAAGALVNGTSITRETAVPETFVYYHVELDSHALILAENVAAETFIDNVDRQNFDNWDEHEALFPQGKAIDEMTYPRAMAHRQVPARIRAMLDERARVIAPEATAAA